MNPDQRLLVVGIYINSALYLAGVFMLGMVTDNFLTMKLAIAAAGVSYLSYAAQVLRPTYVALHTPLVALSIVSGIAAGFELLVR